MDLTYIGYLLFVIPGFCFVWTYRHFTKAAKIGEFEYAVWSFFFGAIIFLFFGVFLAKTHVSLPAIPLDNLSAMLGGFLGIGLTFATVGAFPIGFLAAYVAKMGLFRWIDQKLFYLLDRLPR